VTQTSHPENLSAHIQHEIGSVSLNGTTRQRRLVDTNYGELLARKMLLGRTMGMERLLTLAFLEFLLPVARMMGMAMAAFLALMALGLRLRQTLIVPAGELGRPQPDVLKLRQAAEDEVIAEFLRNEFYHSDFDEVRKEFAAIVLQPNLEDDRENARRRQLLFRKRGGLWRELPRDTAWWQVAIRPSALGRMRVFPRADWRRYSQRGFSLPIFADHIATGLGRAPTDPFLSSLNGLQQQLSKGGDCGTVLLIGVDEDKPLTILEGNHRMVATALMVAPQLQNFRFFCGFSPRMSHCCWYQSSVVNLLHYAGNLVRDFSQFRHSDFAKLIPRKRLAASASLASPAQGALRVSGTGMQMIQSELESNGKDSPA